MPLRFIKATRVPTRTFRSWYDINLLRIETFKTMRDILITGALPYANGSLHLGHLVGYIQADVWARFQRLRGNRCIYISGSDAHGTPIMLKAMQEGIKPEELVSRIREEQIQDFKDFHVEFDNFYTTHSEENRQLAQEIYQRLQQQGLISQKTISQAFDPIEKLFLPDRYVKGTCPRCKSPDQYGDSCEVCGATYNPTDLIDAKSVISGATPIQKESEHFFFDLPRCEQLLKEWTHQKGVLQPEVVNKLNEWFETGLQSWDISRDAPYFGFEIPGHPDKYFYVWLDAPIGYMASFKNKFPELFDAYWNKDSKTELYHFIGKDIIYFHALFWPAILQSANYRKPSGVFANGFLTVNGLKMSKSRGTFIKARTYLNHLNPEYLRYYFARKANDSTVDIDLNLEDFRLRVNSDLVGKVVNIASRCARLLQDNFDNTTSAQLLDNQHTMLQDLDAMDYYAEQITHYYEQRQYNQAMQLTMQLADKTNEYINDQQPWKLIKQPENKHQVQAICSKALDLFRRIIIYLKPILPQTALQAEKFLSVAPLQWTDLDKPLLNHKLNPFTPLMTRIEQQDIDAMNEDSKETTAPATTPSIAPIAPEISIDDLSKVDLRVARIVDAKAVPEADKLLQLTLDLGDHQRNVFAGIKSAYAPEDLIGKLTLVVANLAPRKMRFGVSEAMVLAAGPGGKDLWIFHPDSGAEPGMRAK